MKFKQIAVRGKQACNSVAAKTSALGLALAVPMMAHAEGELWAEAVTQLTGLKAGVIAIGGILLSITIAGAGFLVIRSYAKRA